jgi:NAD(P)-dependent dehydrogenase (short-subunit alcohol dehydrogenase family)
VIRAIVVHPHATNQMPDATTVLVTGATDGIGRAAARQLARRGATVLVHGRDAVRARAVAAEVNAEPGARGDAEPLIADLASLAEVRRLADAVRARGAALDVLLANAGVALRGRARQHSADGFELTFAVNHLAHFLLATSLLDHLTARAAEVGEARVVVVASELPARGPLDFGDLQGERRYDGTTAYARSKLANVLFTRALARRAAGTNVAANALHPGVIHTKLLRDGFGSGGGASVEQGGETLVHAALAPELRGVSGAYFAGGRQTAPAPAARDDAAADRLWEESERLVAPWR